MPQALVSPPKVLLCVRQITEHDGVSLLSSEAREILNITLWKRSQISLAYSDAVLCNDEAAMLEGHRDIV